MKKDKFITYVEVLVYASVLLLPFVLLAISFMGR